MIIQEFLNHWHLERSPFEERADVSFYFSSQQHREGYSRLDYFCEDGNMHLALLSGAIGSGKSILCEKVKHHWLAKNYQVAFFSNSCLTYDDLLNELIAHLLGKKLKNDDALTLHEKQKLFFQIYDHKMATEFKKFIIILDECQLMPMQDLGYLRMLTNYQGKGNPLMIVLSGQPEIRGLLKEIPQLNQRIAIKYHLQPLSNHETYQYIRHRLQLGGNHQEIFTQKAYDQIYLNTGGTPRLINRLCKKVLHFAASFQKNIIDEKCLEVILKDDRKQDEVA